MPGLLPFSRLLRRVRLLLILAVLIAGRAAQAQIYYLDLNQQTLDIPNRALVVEQVLDGRPNQAAAIGTVYRGLNNRPAAAFFRQGLGPELTAWLKLQLPSRPTDHAVVLCVRQLRVSEVMNGMTELAAADLALDVYAHLPDGYHFVRSVAAHTNVRALETTAIHAPHIAKMLEDCLLQLAGVDWARASRLPVHTLAQLPADNPLKTARPAVLRASAPRRGVYFLFEQFLNNRPDTATQLRLDTLRLTAAGWEGTTLLRPRVHTATGDRVAPREVWGFSDGRRAYIRHGKVYRLLNRQDDFYTFVGAAPLDVQAVNQRSQQYAAAGALGAILASPDDNTGQPAAFALDMRTGQVAAFPPLGQAQPSDTAFVYVYRPLSGSPAPQRIMLDDREMGQLRPGEYVELACPRFGHIVRLSSGMAGGAALLLVPNAAAANYIKLQDSPKPGAWQWMPAREGEAEVDALEKQHRR
ncbi:hypothetical protein [Hymenobacter terricola]|uniref:hypothetical protein n=1 Tax=Hymenobacter terricola TaxID=2819236 RepID=UPI001B300D8A|nr:hypothetical protein [Hymenobacter terricola]